MTITLSLASYSLLDTDKGNDVGVLNPRAAAMGSANTYSGYRLFDINTNPANLSLLKGKINFQLNHALTKNSDDRSLPMYDSFDGYAGQATYVSNAHFFSEYSGGISYCHQLENINLAAAFMYKPVINFDAEYEEEVRNNENSDNNNYPPVIADNYITSEGQIHSLAFLTSMQYNDFMSFGLEFSQLSGDAQMEKELIWTDLAQTVTSDSLSNQYFEIDRDFSGFQIKAGANIKLSPHFGFGFSMSPKTELDVTGQINDTDFDEAFFYNDTLIVEQDTTNIDTTITTHYYDEKYDPYIIPMKFRLGGSYRPRNIMRTNFNFDIEYVKWSDIDELYDDALNFYLGIEHKIKNTIPLRFGFNYKTDYQKIDIDNSYYVNKITMPTFTIGSGFKFMEKFTFDISCEYSHREYETLDLFPDAAYDYQELWVNYQYLNLESRGWENPDTVNENFLKFKTALSYHW